MENVGSERWDARLYDQLFPEGTVSGGMGYGIPEIGYGSRYGYGIGVGYGIQGMGYGSWAMGYGIRETGYGSGYDYGSPDWIVVEKKVWSFSVSVK